MKLSAHSLIVGARLRDVSATLQPGTITAICGPNGAGKSTLLSVLAGTVMPEGGEVRLDDQPLSVMHARDRAKRLGYLPQEGAVAWDVSLRTLVALGRYPHGDGRTQPVDAAIAALDLGHLAERPVSKLSGGERARALLARVLAGEPQWVLADEPLAALDLAHQMRLIRQLRESADQGAGVVLVLHDLALAMNHADRVIVLDQGKLAADGPAQEALSSAMIAQVWAVDAQWVGQPGERALVVRPA